LGKDWEEDRSEDSDDSDDDEELNERKGTFIGHDFHRDVGTVSTTQDEFARG
jgi:hypothetical protein